MIPIHQFVLLLRNEDSFLDMCSKTTEAYINEKSFMVMKSILAYDKLEIFI